MITWIQVMAEVRRLDDVRRREGKLAGPDAERLVTMLLAFHLQATKTLTPAEMAAAVPPAGSHKK